VQAPSPIEDLVFAVHPVLVGVLSIAFSVLIVFVQYVAVIRRGLVSSLAVGALLMVTGVATCLGPWDVIRDTRAGIYLFCGIVMWRWGKELKAARAAAHS
jgi:hypothetical protein